MDDPRLIKVGDRLEPFTRETGFHHWNRYAAVNDEFVPIHMDDEAGQAAGYASAFGMGNLQWSYLHNLLRRWMGDAGEIVSLGCQFRNANVKGQTVTAHGTVTAVERDGDRIKVDLEVWTEEQTGAKLAPGHATVAFSLAE
jgi:acyl dehydratase